MKIRLQILINAGERLRCYQSSHDYIFLYFSCRRSFSGSKIIFSPMISLIHDVYKLDMHQFITALCTTTINIYIPHTSPVHHFIHHPQHSSKFSPTDGVLKPKICPDRGLPPSPARLGGTLGGGGEDPVHLCQAQPRPVLCTGHE